jgi:hypothetical protein
LLLRFELGKHTALILELGPELLELPSPVLQPAYVAVETFLAIREALLAAFQVST